MEISFPPRHYADSTCPMSGFSTVSLQMLFHCVVLLSTFCIIPSLTSIKSLHPQTDQREGLSLSLFTPYLRFDTDFSVRSVKSGSAEDASNPSLKNDKMNITPPSVCSVNLSFRLPVCMIPWIVLACHSSCLCFDQPCQNTQGVPL